MKENEAAYKEQITRAQHQLDSTSKALEQFDKLKKQLEKFGGKGLLQFRVYFAPDEEHKVILVEGIAAKVESLATE